MRAQTPVGGAQRLGAARPGCPNSSLPEGEGRRPFRATSQGSEEGQYGGAGGRGPCKGSSRPQLHHAGRGVGGGIAKAVRPAWRAQPGAASHYREGPVALGAGGRAQGGDRGSEALEPAGLAPVPPTPTAIGCERGRTERSPRARSCQWARPPGLMDAPPSTNGGSGKPGRVAPASAYKSRRAGLPASF
ncbi:unnamed protein product [Rangifer tarandus platyrhynchus]|uniref:Uncharacterized protein n=2 Tax=Rangifer tarandus platyrhynchus TaxID=3082113 RepID=A0ABN8ZLE6_RANTA|nr:unnamed protein product [Rangifer tarandus platyrhynchus]CAI9706773.1 unnamed protein product [Rangifer tarandus platyrhynchus]